MWKFKPINKPKIWGGERWEISGMSGDESVVACGPDAGMTLPELIGKYKAALLGERVHKKYGGTFPLLVKFINSNQDLSVQVHPDDSLAVKLGYPWGKTEMWYVAATGRGARIANGFIHPIDPEDYDSMVSSGKIEDVLKYIDIIPGDIYYIPSGRVHAICGECLILEIQQSSDITYRIYDYNRRDNEGNLRELHTELARKAINFQDTQGAPVSYLKRDNIPVNVVKSPYFCTNLLKADSELMRDYSESDSFVILICTEGKAEITSNHETQIISEGTSLLIPASSSGISIAPSPSVSLIETYIT